MVGPAGPSSAARYVNTPSVVGVEGPVVASGVRRDRNHVVTPLRGLTQRGDREDSSDENYKRHPGCDRHPSTLGHQAVLGDEAEVIESERRGWNSNTTFQILTRSRLRAFGLNAM